MYIEVWLLRECNIYICTVLWYFQRQKEDIGLLYQDRVYRILNILLREGNCCHLKKKKKKEKREREIDRDIHVLYKYLFCNGRVAETDFGFQVC